MAWFNPWGEARALRASLTAERNANVLLRNQLLIADSTQGKLLAKIREHSEQINQLIREKQGLRNLLRGAHIRDPKTGRIQKRGAV